MLRRLAIIMMVMAPVSLAADLGSDLRNAAGGSKLSAVIGLLDAGAPVDAKNDNGRTPLIQAAAYGRTEIVKLLLERGAAVNWEDSEGFTALRAAAVEGHLETTRVLLDGRAEVNHRHKTGITALMAATARQRTETVRLLTERGADVKIKSEPPDPTDALCIATSKRTRHRTVSHPEITQILIEAGANPAESACFLDPDWSTKGPETIAILKVEDSRTEKVESAKLTEEFARSSAEVLRGRLMRYTVQEMPEVRSKLLAAGISAEGVDKVDWSTACRILATDSVFEVELLDFAKMEGVIVQATGYRVRIALTDCGSGKPLWNVTQTVTVARGFLIRAFVSATKMAAEFAINFPKKGSK